MTYARHACALRVFRNSLTTASTSAADRAMVNRELQPIPQLIEEIDYLFSHIDIANGNFDYLTHNFD